MRKKDPWYRGCFPAGVSCAFLLTGCLYTTHHFNNGRLLEPGRTSLTLGAGKFRSPDYGCPEPAGYEDHTPAGIKCLRFRNASDSVGNPVYALDTLDPARTWNSTFKTSLGYRLGVHGRFGPLAGAEIGLHLEMPTNPVSMEFDLKLGLPVPAGRPYHHSLSGGLGIGAWADNSYFAEYALSRAFGASDLFVNYRATYLATQIPDLNGSESRQRFGSHRRLIHQASLGFLWTLPDLPVIPDYLVPLAVLTYPLAPAGASSPPDRLLDEHVFDFSLGFGWRFR